MSSLVPLPTNNRTDLLPRLDHIFRRIREGHMRLAGYSRVSTDLQREKETVLTQNQLIEKYCEANGHTLVELFCDDGVSGTTHLGERPAASRLLEAARAGKFQGIVVYKADRIARDTLVAELAVRELHDELGLVFHGMARPIDLATPIGRAMFTFQSAIGRLERENTLQRSRDATLRLAREGVWLGGIVPFGYRVEGKDREARLRISDEPIPGMNISEADVVKMIYQWSGDEGLSCIVIADKLNQMGVPTVYARDSRNLLIPNKRRKKTQEVWRAGRVRNFLVESTYRGVHVWGKRAKRKVLPGGAKGERPETIERAVPAIVSEDLWKKAQVTLHNNRLCRPDIEKRPYLIRGLMKCCECGATWVGTVSPGKHISVANKEELEDAEVRGEFLLRSYYVCNASHSRHKVYGQTGRPCQSGYIRAQEIEALVWSEIEGFLFTPDVVVDELRARLLEQLGGAGEVEKQLENLHSQKMVLEDERAVLLRYFRRGTLSEADMERQLKELADEEKTLGEQIEKLEREAARAKDATSALATAETYLGRLRAKLEAEVTETGEVSWNTKRRVVEALVAGVEVESVFDPMRKRGQQRAATLHISYRFEEPEMELGRARPRTGKSAKVVAGLSLKRTHLVVAKMESRKDERVEWVREAIEDENREGRELRIEDVIGKIKRERGVVLSRAGVCRMRMQLGLAPDSIQSRAGRMGGEAKRKTDEKKAELI